MSSVGSMGQTSPGLQPPKGLDTYRPQGLDVLISSVLIIDLSKPRPVPEQVSLAVTHRACWVGSPILFGAGPGNEQTQGDDLLGTSEHEGTAQGPAPGKSRWRGDTRMVL